jgi:2-amino-1-hydroxyethylphosphonate dioxygenase (glycine-forming)
MDYFQEQIKWTMHLRIAKITDEIFDLYEKYGQADYIGEPVSQIEHMSQSAQLAIKEGYDDEVVLAAFFHDIGHICVQSQAKDSMGGYGTKRHEQIGADFLRAKGFPEKMAKLVEYHVQAKRYLTFKFPQYYDNLSEASKHTLEFQGGKMNAPEALDFEQDSLFETSIAMRKWDELAKEIGVPIISLSELKVRTQNILEISLKEKNN